MTEKLLGLSYRNITFLGEAGDDWTRGAARRKGFQKAMRRAGLDGNRVLQVGRPPLSIENGAAATPQLLETFPDTDCVFCVSDAAAFGVQSALKSRGIAVPEEIGVAGFGNFEFSRFASPTISTVVVDSFRIGREAGQLIGRLLGEGAEKLGRVNIDIDPRPDLRLSTKPL
ncbi:MAG: substrate-binding domain-containing protein [Cyanobacteria bacterium J06648_11]